MTRFNLAKQQKKEKKKTYKFYGIDEWMDGWKMESRRKKNEKEKKKKVVKKIIPLEIS